MYISILILPLLGFLSSALFGRYMGRHGVQYFTTFLMLLTTIFSLIAFYEVGILGSSVYYGGVTWMEAGLLNISWGFLFDSLTVSMLIVINGISFLVHFYSIGYMSEDAHIQRFMSYLSLFTFFMLILVTADNLVQLFVGWEGVGLSSYLLINFWHTRLQANKSAMKAMIVNRIGDFGLSLAMFAIYYTYKSLNFSTIFAMTPYLNNEKFMIYNIEIHSISLICFLLFVGAVGKSAQLGLHTWLPDAMEGPTPVSALIHAATMVTAGVFLIIRCSSIFEYAPIILNLMTIIGALTAFFAATSALLQNDLKRVIAYSTCSQLGYMVFACGISNYYTSMFHLMNHAYFKALLFLSAGAVIHAMNDEQDMRKMGGLVKIIPFTYAMMFIGSLSLMGFPFLTGFYSKDMILELSYGTYMIPSYFAFYLGTISAAFTAFYSFRLLYLTFFNDHNSHKPVITHAHEPSYFMKLPLILLAFGSIFIGFMTKDMLVGLGSTFWSNTIFMNPMTYHVTDAEFMNVNIKLTPVIFSFIGAFTAIILYHYMNNFLLYMKTRTLSRVIYSFLNKKWYVDNIYNQIFLNTIIYVSHNFFFKTLDKGWIEHWGPAGLTSAAIINSKTNYKNNI